MPIALRRMCPLFASLLALALLAGCATRPTQDDSENDPLEPVNRNTFVLNKSIDTFLIRPLAVTYRDLVPDVIKTMVSNFLDYIRTPIVLANDLLQGDFHHLDITAQRFMQNTITLGLGDPATQGGLQAHDADFGLTLASWGAKEGPYLVIPVVGPSNVRDGIGLLVDTFLDPITWISRTDSRAWMGYTNMVSRLVVYRADSLKDLDQLEAQSLDFYAGMRSLYRQYRDGQIRANNPKQGGASPTYYELMSPALTSDTPITSTSSVEQ
ncbi:MAG: VacJ family lipoprotein [Proteobacteria bacterium]|nr:VacJ family lipoprotein [Pseudomonadota bacterium]MBI3497718.1 VacJ family lipoprotein [Pseudomonadota bacterium]